MCVCVCAWCAPLFGSLRIKLLLLNIKAHTRTKSISIVGGWPRAPLHYGFPHTHTHLHSNTQTPLRLRVIKCTHSAQHVFNLIMSKWLYGEHTTRTKAFAPRTCRSSRGMCFLVRVCMCMSVCARIVCVCRPCVCVCVCTVRERCAAEIYACHVFMHRRRARPAAIVAHKYVNTYDGTHTFSLSTPLCRCAHIYGHTHTQFGKRK